jgi:hypothetical protein
MLCALIKYDQISLSFYAVMNQILGRIDEDGLRCHLLVLDRPLAGRKTDL